MSIDNGSTFYPSTGATTSLGMHNPYIRRGKDNQPPTLLSNGYKSYMAKKLGLPTYADPRLSSELAKPELEQGLIVYEKAFPQLTHSAENALEKQLAGLSHILRHLIDYTLIESSKFSSTSDCVHKIIEPSSIMTQVIPTGDALNKPRSSADIQVLLERFEEGRRKGRYLVSETSISVGPFGVLIDPNFSSNDYPIEIYTSTVIYGKINPDLDIYTLGRVMETNGHKSGGFGYNEVYTNNVVSFGPYIEVRYTKRGKFTYSSNHQLMGGTLLRPDYAFLQLTADPTNMSALANMSIGLPGSR